jgi:hypothetical protein
MRCDLPLKLSRHSASGTSTSRSSTDTISTARSRPSAVSDHERRPRKPERLRARSHGAAPARDARGALSDERGVVLLRLPGCITARRRRQPLNTRARDRLGGRVCVRVPAEALRTMRSTTASDEGRPSDRRHQIQLEPAVAGASGGPEQRDGQDPQPRQTRQDEDPDSASGDHQGQPCGRDVEQRQRRERRSADRDVEQHHDKRPGQDRGES